MTRELAPNIWFVRSNGGSGSYPVTAEGRRVVRNFIIGMAGSVVAAAVLAIVGPVWLWVVVFVLGMVLSAGWFIKTARAHTDFSVTYNDYVKDKKNA
jgi:hypothetical protein